MAGSSELLDRLRMLPEPGSLDLLRRLRMADDRSAAWLEGAVSSTTTDMDKQFPLPPVQSSLEFELMIRHPIAYPALCPLDQYPGAASRSRELFFRQSTQVLFVAPFLSVKV